ncbi:hypothetical protein FHX37_4029 [Haloactinospora alba]|uniref:DUF4352 domain-containing protein n=1 Tax=Haloactinospora alba TaxID=405555 RepID=A0A543NA28_9ACTN|nr:hypothetical protein [Haloactinospora alba]TQN28670.1 hypothetical protein FHX37_4029 [Haloactinospora alba]
MSRFVHWTLTTVISATLIAAIMGAHRMIPSAEELTEPVTYSGTAGTAVDAERFTLTVDKVQLARSAADADSTGGPQPIEANGVWVIVWATVESTRTTLTSVHPELDTGTGATYSGSSWLNNTLSGTAARFDPGIPRYGAFAFEVPEDQLADPALRVALSESAETRLAAQAEADLELEGEELTRRIDTADESVSLPPTETR